MFIKYSGTNVHALPHVNKAVKGQKQMMQSPSDVKWLRPGWNEFPSETWKLNEKHPQIQKMLRKGIIELFTAKVKVKILDKKSGRIKIVEKTVGQDDKPMRLKYFDEKLALKIVKGTLDRDILQRWIDEETRHKVKKALRKQIEPLMNHGDDEDEDDYEDNEDDFE